MHSPIPDAEYVHRFNAHLAELNSPARVALIRIDAPSGMLELRDDGESTLAAGKSGQMVGPGSGNPDGGLPIAV